MSKITDNTIGGKRNGWALRIELKIILRENVIRKGTRSDIQIQRKRKKSVLQIGIDTT